MCGMPVECTLAVEDVDEPAARNAISCDPPREAVGESSAGPALRQAGKHILIVEDERIIAKDLQRSLLQLGYDVAPPVATAEAAIRAACEMCPDLVLMDIHIGGAQDGIETAQILRSRFDTPVVYLTAFADPETVARAAVTEPLGYLVKPVKPDELRAAVEVALHKHQMERRLRERERWFATTLTSIGDAVISTDPQGAVTFMNRAAEVLTGRRAEYARGQPIASLLRLVANDGADFTLSITEALRSGKVLHVDAKLTALDGTEREIADSVAPIIDDRGAVHGAVLVFSDVSEERRLQRQLELADRLASLGTMAAGVAHEINNPLAVVMASVRQRTEPAPPPWLEQVSGALADALEATHRVRRITTDLKHFARPVDTSRDHCDLRAAVNAAVRLTRKELESTARPVIELAETPPVRADETRLVQVFVNLLLNAAQAMAGERDRERAIRITSVPCADGYVRVDVADTGPGISPELLPCIFEPFVTTKVGRSNGLGLAICRGIAIGYGGEISVDSEVGRGTTFHLTLRVAEDTPPQGAAPLQPEPSLRRGRILVVDDDPLVRSVLQRSLAPHHDVVVAGSLSEARARLAQGGNYDLVLCDLMLGEESGMDLYEEQMRSSPETSHRFVFLTGGAYTARAAEFLASVTNPVIEKPFSHLALLQRLDELLAETSR
jgi:two-component system cell cycle sensor histidine kinase/response regulator CckA